MSSAASRDSHDEESTDSAAAPGPTELWPIELRRYGKLLEVGARSCVFSEGHPADGVFLLIAGAVKVTRTPDQGLEEVTLELVWPGMPFGDEGLVPGRKWLSTARTLSRSRVLKIDRAGLEDAMRRSPRVALDLMERMARRNGAVHERILELTWDREGDRIDSAYERLADLVEGGGIDGHFDEADVASHAAVPPQAVRTHARSRGTRRD